MAAKLLIVLVALVSTASAQTTMMMMPETTPAPMPTTEEAPTTEGPTMGGMNVTVAEPNATIQDRFVASQANQTRGDHFYCLGINSTRTDFRSIRYRWGLWIQYPVLSYLDSMRKRHLFYVISRMAQINDFDDICVAEVEQYGVSTYRESVFVKLYIRGSDDVDLLQRYDMNFRSSFLSSSSPYVEMFLGRRALNINSAEPSDGRPVLSGRTVNDSVHPGCDMESCPEGDPTLLAVVLGTYWGPWYVTRYGEEVDITVADLMGGGLLNSTLLEPFAENPRPINYGLEAGDIVFAVFGSIFLTILIGAIILGFVIHPFFLS